MSAYKSYSNDATKVQEAYASTEKEMNSLSASLVIVNAELLSTLPEIHRLSETPDTVVELNSVLVDRYNPVLSKQIALISKINALKKQLEGMQTAMLEPQYLADLEVHTANRSERDRIKAARRLENERLEAKRQLEEKLVIEAYENINEEEIKAKIEKKSFNSERLTKRAANINVGDVAAVMEDTGGRCNAVTWAMPCVVVLKHVQQDDSAAAAYVVCSFGRSYGDNLECRVVEEAALYSLPANHSA